MKQLKIIRFLNILMTLLLSGILGLVLYWMLPTHEIPSNNPGPVVEHTGQISGDVNEPGEEPLASAESNPAQEAVDFSSMFETDPSQISAEQKEVLSGLLSALQTGNRQQAGELLLEWYHLYDEQDTHISGYSYNGASLSTNYSGIALASDGPTRFYYGPLEDGVPNGEGRRLVLLDIAGEIINYFWLEGTWQNGVLTGEAVIVMDSAPIASENEMRDTYELFCAFDGDEEEIISSALVYTSQVIREWNEERDEVTPVVEYQFSFHISDGRLVADEWRYNDSYGNYQLSSTNTYHNNYGYIGLQDLEMVFYQNPFPWGEDYRYAYQELFGYQLWVTYY